MALILQTAKRLTVVMREFPNSFGHICLPQCSVSPIADVCPLPKLGGAVRKICYVSPRVEGTVRIAGRLTGMHPA